MKRLDLNMDIVDDEWDEANDYRRVKNKRTNMRLQEVSSQVKLSKNEELAKFANHLMCKAAQLRVRLNGTEGEEASGEDGTYRLNKPRHKEKVARKRLVNKDDQLKVVMAEVDFRMNTELKGAMGPKSPRLGPCIFW